MLEAKVLPAQPQWIGVKRRWDPKTEDPFAQLVSLTPEEMRTHTLLIGATGSGKTNLLHHLIAQDILRGHSFVVLDLRGDLVSAALELCAPYVDPRRIWLLDLREKERSLGFNPLKGVGDPYFRALNVLDVAASEADSWGVQLAETLRNALLLLAEAGHPLTKLEALFFDRRFRLESLARCTSESVVSFWQRFDELSGDRQGAFATPVLNKISLLLATPTLRAVLGHPSPPDLAEHLDRPGNIFLVSLAVDELHAAGRMMGRLVLASLCREIFARVNTGESRRNPVRLYVDEFEHFGMSEFETVLAEGRRFGLSLVLAHQTLAQLSPRMRSMVLGNVGTKVAFRCGREDSATLSKDLAGDPKAFDFSSFQTGEAVMWRRGQKSVEVEINEPLIRDVGRRGRRASDLVKRIQLYVSPFEAETPSPEDAKTEEPGGQHASDPLSVQAGASILESFLGGVGGNRS